MPCRDPIWDDLAALAFELLAKPDTRAAGHDDASDADQEEREP